MTDNNTVYIVHAYANASGADPDWCQIFRSEEDAYEYGKKVRSYPGIDFVSVEPIDIN